MSVNIHLIENTSNEVWRPQGLLHIYFQCGTYSYFGLLIKISTLKLKAVYRFEMSVPTYQLHGIITQNTTIWTCTSCYATSFCMMNHLLGRISRRSLWASRKVGSTSYCFEQKFNFVNKFYSRFQAEPTRFHLNSQSNFGDQTQGQKDTVDRHDQPHHGCLRALYARVTHTYMVIIIPDLSD